MLAGLGGAPREPQQQPEKRHGSLLAWRGPGERVGAHPQPVLVVQVDVQGAAVAVVELFAPPLLGTGDRVLRPGAGLRGREFGELG